MADRAFDVPATAEGRLRKLAGGALAWFRSRRPGRRRVAWTYRPALPRALLLRDLGLVEADAQRLGLRP